MLNASRRQDVFIGDGRGVVRCMIYRIYSYNDSQSESFGILTTKTCESHIPFFFSTRQPPEGSTGCRILGTQCKPTASK
jgi:hypothetical protein